MTFKVKANSPNPSGRRPKAPARKRGIPQWILEAQRLGVFKGRMVEEHVLRNPPPVLEDE